jgi:hypothetical protein
MYATTEKDLTSETDTQIRKIVLARPQKYGPMIDQTLLFRTVFLEFIKPPPTAVRNLKRKDATAQPRGKSRNQPRVVA